MAELQSEPKFKINFPQSDDANANIFAHDLADFLNDKIHSSEGFFAAPERKSHQSQDFGGTLVLILGTAAATAVAKGIQSWLKGHTGASMEIMTDKGQVVLRNIESKSAAEIAKAFTEIKK